MRGWVIPLGSETGIFGARSTSFFLLVNATLALSVGVGGIQRRFLARPPLVACRLQTHSQETYTDYALDHVQMHCGLNMRPHMPERGNHVV